MGKHRMGGATLVAKRAYVEREIPYFVLVLVLLLVIEITVGVGPSIESRAEMLAA